MIPGSPDVEQEVLRHQPKHVSEGCDWKLPGVHPVPQDPSQRADEGGPSSGPGAVLHHHERARLPGA